MRAEGNDQQGHYARSLDDDFFSVATWGLASGRCQRHHARMRCILRLVITRSDDLKSRTAAL